MVIERTCSSKKPIALKLKVCHTRCMTTKKAPTSHKPFKTLKAKTTPVSRKRVAAKVKTILTEESFRDALAALINYHSREVRSNTPDFILAGFLTDCLDAYDFALSERMRFLSGKTKER